ncbi:hypothetical protein H9P43_001659 [Blastocladiella emersonii ATCC 22665]|nr:hypothetical protein H9P43_001659 [Blastocladiella emersonii ATCC 22665]
MADGRRTVSPPGRDDDAMDVTPDAPPPPRFAPPSIMPPSLPPMPPPTSSLCGSGLLLQPSTIAQTPKRSLYLSDQSPAPLMWTPSIETPSAARTVSGTTPAVTPVSGTTPSSRAPHSRRSGRPRHVDAASSSLDAVSNLPNDAPSFAQELPPELRANGSDDDRSVDFSGSVHSPLAPVAPLFPSPWHVHVVQVADGDASTQSQNHVAATPSRLPSSSAPANVGSSSVACTSCMASVSCVCGSPSRSPRAHADGDAFGLSLSAPSPRKRSRGSPRAALVSAPVSTPVSGSDTDDFTDDDNDDLPADARPPPLKRQNVADGPAVTAVDELDSQAHLSSQTSVHSVNGLLPTSAAIIDAELADTSVQLDADTSALDAANSAPHQPGFEDDSQANILSPPLSPRIVVNGPLPPAVAVMTAELHPVLAAAPASLAPPCDAPTPDFTMAERSSPIMWGDSQDGATAVPTDPADLPMPAPGSPLMPYPDPVAVVQSVAEPAVIATQPSTSTEDAPSLSIALTQRALTDSLDRSDTVSSAVSLPMPSPAPLPEPSPSCEEVAELPHPPSPGSIESAVPLAPSSPPPAVPVSPALPAREASLSPVAPVVQRSPTPVSAAPAPAFATYSVVPSAAVLSSPAPPAREQLSISPARPVVERTSPPPAPPAPVFAAPSVAPPPAVPVDAATASFAREASISPARPAVERSPPPPALLALAFAAASVVPPPAAPAGAAAASFVPAASTTVVSAASATSAIAAPPAPPSKPKYRLAVRAPAPPKGRSFAEFQQGLIDDLRGLRGIPAPNNAPVPDYMPAFAPARTVVDVDAAPETAHVPSVVKFGSAAALAPVPQPEPAVAEAEPMDVTVEPANAPSRLPAAAPAPRPDRATARPKYRLSDRPAEPVQMKRSAAEIKALLLADLEIGSQPNEGPLPVAQFASARSVAPPTRPRPAPPAFVAPVRAAPRPAARVVHVDGDEPKPAPAVPPRPVTAFDPPPGVFVTGAGRPTLAPSKEGLERARKWINAPSNDDAQAELAAFATSSQKAKPARPVVQQQSRLVQREPEPLDRARSMTPPSRPRPLGASAGPAVTPAPTPTRAVGLHTAATPRTTTSQFRPPMRRSSSDVSLGPRTPLIVTPASTMSRQSSFATPSLPPRAASATPAVAPSVPATPVRGPRPMSTPGTMSAPSTAVRPAAPASVTATENQAPLRPSHTRKSSNGTMLSMRTPSRPASTLGRQAASRPMFKTPLRAPSAAKDGQTATAQLRTPATTPAAGRRRSNVRASTPAATPTRTAGVASVFDLPPVPSLDRVSLRSLGAPAVGRGSVPQWIARITSETAAWFRFPGAAQWGPSDVHAALLAAGAVPKLVSEDWTRNHYRWIVWKLACQHRAYAANPAAAAQLPPFTTDTVVRQLLYRYEREVVRAERPVLRRIVERDETAHRPMVLCVARIVAVEDPESGKAIDALELTDGWYSITAKLDAALLRAVDNGRIVVGGKLLVGGASLVASGDGVPVLDTVPTWSATGSELTPPDHAAVSLKLCGNSTKPARWDAKLGHVAGPPTVPVALRALAADGGPFSEIAVQILRVYPTMYMEIFPNGEKAYRNLREEQAAQADYERLLVLGGGAEGTRVRSFARRPADAIDDEELARAVALGTIQHALAEVSPAVAAQLQERLAQLPDHMVHAAREAVKRNVTPFFRIKVACARQSAARCVDADGDPVPVATAVLTVWRPDESMLHEIREGRYYRVVHGQVSGSFRDVLRLSTTRGTRWVPLAGPIGDAPSPYVPRETVRDFAQLADTGDGRAREIDVEGVVVRVRKPAAHTAAPLEIHLADARGCAFAVFRAYVQMWIPSFHDSLKPGTSLALRNVRWTGDDAEWQVAQLAATDETEIRRVSAAASLPAPLHELVARLDAVRYGGYAPAKRARGGGGDEGVDWAAFFSQSP